MPHSLTNGKRLLEIKKEIIEELENKKEEYIAELEKRVADKILEPENFKLLKKLVENADNPNEALMIAELGTTYKRTGFHFDKRLEKKTERIAYLKKNENFSFVTDKNALTHKLIIGDNYPALLNLLIEYKGKVDVIYIDPPYGKDNMGEFAETNYDNAITRDNLLSMLYPRLWLAKRLLSDSGVIFCSIDDRNQAYVKGLFDEVFEERNFVGNLKWKRKKQPSFLHGHIASVIEYVMVYAKHKDDLERLSIENRSDLNTRVDNKSNAITERSIKKGIRVKLEDCVIKAGIYQNKTMTTEYIDDVVVKNGRTANDFRVKARFRNDQSGINNFIKNDVIFITKNYGFRRDLLEEELLKRKSITDLLLDWGDNQDSDNEIKEVFGDNKPFDYPKPINLIFNLIKSVDTPDNAIILDFFAGSGTTGQAVLELNKEDGEKRSFILVTNDEKTEKNPNGIATDVTSKRLKRVMSGKCYDGTCDFEWIKKNKPLGDNLLVLDIAEVTHFEETEGKTPFDVIDETLYGEKKFNSVKEKVEWVCDNFEITEKRIFGEQE